MVCLSPQDHCFQPETFSNELSTVQVSGGLKSDVLDQLIIGIFTGRISNHWTIPCLSPNSVIDGF